MKPVLKISTPNNSEAFFTHSGYEKKRSPLPSPAVVDLGEEENAYPFTADRSLWRRLTSWTSGKGRSGLGRRALLVGFVGLMWILLMMRDQHVSPNILLTCSTRLMYQSGSLVVEPAILVTLYRDRSVVTGRSTDLLKRYPWKPVSASD